MRSTLSDTQWTEIHDSLIAGESVLRIAHRYGRKPTALYGPLKSRFGFVPTDAQRADGAGHRQANSSWFADEDSAAIYARAIAGESPISIARDYDRDKTSIYRHLGARYGYRARDYRRAVWKSTWVPPTEATDLAYTAGIIDGEGCIMKITRGRTHPLWIVRVNMTDEPVIRWLHSFGGTFCERPSKIEGRKDQWEWHIHRQLDVQAFLTAILPYMRVKRATATEAIDYLVSRQPMGHDGRLAQYMNGEGPISV